MKGMQFFKHPCNASLHPAIQEIEQRYGWAGLGFFWKLVENIYLCNGSYPLEAALSWRVRGLRRVVKLAFLSDKVIPFFFVSSDGVITLDEEFLLNGAQADTPMGAHAYAPLCAQVSAKAHAYDPVPAQTLPTILKEKKRVERKTHTRSIDIMIDSAQNDEERDFYKQMTERYPRVCGMTRPLSYQELDKLIKDGFALERIAATLMEMENHVNLQKKYVSAYLTLRNWLRRG